MKKLILFFAVLLTLLAMPAAAEQLCPLMWDGLAKHTFAAAINGIACEAVFSDGFAGPCPQGNVEFFADGKSMGVFHYTTTPWGLVKINVDGVDLPFVLVHDYLLLVPGKAIILVRK